MDNKTFNTRLSQSLGMPQDQVETLAAALTARIRHSCADGYAVALPSFGRFDPVKTDEHIDVDPEGHRTLYPPRVDVEFSLSSIFKKHFNN